MQARARFALSTPRRGYQGYYVEGDAREAELAPVVRAFRADHEALHTLAEIEREHARAFDHALLPALYSLLLIRTLRRAGEPRPQHDACSLLEHIDGILLANRYTDYRTGPTPSELRARAREGD